MRRHAQHRVPHRARARLTFVNTRDFGCWQKLTTHADQHMIERIAELHWQQLIKQANYRQYVAARADAGRGEGAPPVDTFMAAKILRQAAKDAGDTQLASQKLAVLTELLAQVLGRKIDWEAREKEGQQIRRILGGLPPDDVSPRRCN